MVLLSSMHGAQNEFQKTSSKNYFSPKKLHPFLEGNNVTFRCFTFTIAYILTFRLYMYLHTNSRWHGPRGREPGCSHTHSSPASPHHEPPGVPQGAGKRQLWQGRSFWKMENIEKHFSTVFIHFVFRYIKNLHKKKKPS